MYSCHYSTQYARYQCCSSMASGFSMSAGFGMSRAMADTAETTECEVGSARIKGRCMRCNHFLMLCFVFPLKYFCFRRFVSGEEFITSLAGSAGLEGVGFSKVTQDQILVHCHSKSLLQLFVQSFDSPVRVFPPSALPLSIIFDAASSA